LVVRRRGELASDLLSERRDVPGCAVARDDLFWRVELKGVAFLRRRLRIE
jgi:hypothetical protein